MIQSCMKRLSFLFLLLLFFSVVQAQLVNPNAVISKLMKKNTSVKLKLLYQTDRQHFGIGATQGVRRFPGFEKAIDFPATTTVTPKTGFSIWTAEGGITVIFQYEVAEGKPAPKEIVLEGIDEVGGNITGIIIMCCAIDGGSTVGLVNTNSVLNSPPNTVGLSIGLVEPGGTLYLLGNGCAEPK
ncbi:MAG: hypothetical protein SFU87_18070, partial [Chitinophagaceae bacterium]|nr:hypothetical protein [Chitinophagaceae bacterium]